MLEGAEGPYTAKDASLIIATLIGLARARLPMYRVLSWPIDYPITEDGAVFPTAPALVLDPEGRLNNWREASARFRQLAKPYVRVRAATNEVRPADLVAAAAKVPRSQLFPMRGQLHRAFDKQSENREGPDSE